MPFQMTVFANALAFSVADAHRDTKGAAPAPTMDDVIRFLCHGVKPDVVPLVERYYILKEGMPELSIVPGVKKLLDKLFAPMRGALCSFMLGHHYGTIALSGLACEMLAIVLSELHEERLIELHKAKPKKGPASLAEFEAAGQERRVKMLLDARIIDSTMKSYFSLVRTRRRQHLHLWSHEGELSTDAGECFRATMLLLERVFQVKVRNGKVIITEAMRRYIDKHGTIEHQPAGSTLMP
jgi:hypothetical protein